MIGCALNVLTLCSALSGSVLVPHIVPAGQGLGGLLQHSQPFGMVLEGNKKGHRCFETNPCVKTSLSASTCAGFQVENSPRTVVQQWVAWPPPTRPLHGFVSK